MVYFLKITSIYLCWGFFKDRGKNLGLKYPEAKHWDGVGVGQGRKGSMIKNYFLAP